jgi:Fic family protein
MTDTQLNSLDIRLNNLPSSIYSKLSTFDQMKGRWQANGTLPKAVMTNLKRSVLATSTGASTRIEGSKLTDEEVVKVMKGLEIGKFTDRDEQEVRGYFEVLEIIFDNFDVIHFSESQILSLHSQLLKYVDKDQQHKGNYKHSENAVQLVSASGQVLGPLFETTPAYLTPKQMSELIEWTVKVFRESVLHPLLIIGSFVVEFLKIHPFMDGNGRMSRLLTNLLLLQTDHSYALISSQEKLIEDSKVDYYLALRRSQSTFGTKDESILPWLDYFLDINIQQLSYALEILNNSQVEKLLSPNQNAILQFMQDKDDVAIRDLVAALSIPRPTASQSLDKLVEYKLIERIGLGRSTRYRKV